MPSRNRIKQYSADAYYHIYNRGVEKREIFLDDADYSKFLSLLERHLSGEEWEDKRGRSYIDLSKEVELLAYCLRPNHIHLLLYQIDPEGMTRLLRRVMTAYSMYFNLKYDRVGGLFQERFKAALIFDEKHLWHISRYIHLNAIPPGAKFENPEHHRYSSYRYYQGQLRAPWIRPDRILAMHAEMGESYEEFMRDYADYRASWAQVEPLLAL